MHTQYQKQTGTVKQHKQLQLQQQETAPEQPKRKLRQPQQWRKEVRNKVWQWLRTSEVISTGSKETEHQNKVILVDFDFITNPRLPIHKNMLRWLLKMTLTKFFSYCSNRSFHNLCIDNHILNSAAWLLGLGLKFCICDHPPPSDLLDFQFDHFNRDVQIKYFVMCNSDPTECNDSDYEPKIYVCNTSWNPPNATPAMERALVNFKASIAAQVHLNHSHHFCPNLSWHELQQIHALCNNENIIILQSDKNLGIVAMDTDWYTQKVLMEHLLDPNQYEILAANKALQHQTEAAQKMWQLIGDNSSDFKPSECQYFEWHYKQCSLCRVPLFYGNPKVHKKGIPLRPIVSKVNSEIEILSIFLDYQLHHLLPLCKQYVRDSWHLLDLLDNMEDLPMDAHLITLDAKAMYSNIDTDHAINLIGCWFR